jgi:hypothetical protein
MSHTKSRELNAVLAAALGSGWRVRRTNNNHLMAVSPGGSVVVVGTTPSDKRAFLNTRARIRRIDQQEQQP